MKRTLEDIRANMDHVGCDNETALELCDEIERLWDVLSWIDNFDPETTAAAEAKFHFDLVQRKISDQ